MKAHRDTSHINTKDSKYNKARSDIISFKNNKLDFIDSYIQKNLDFFCCTSAESSSTRSHNTMQLDSNITPNSHLISKIKLSTCSDLEPGNPQPCISKNDTNIHLESNINYNYNQTRADDSSGVMELEGVVCSMCGDVGIAELLFVCAKCSQRPQHIYCGRSYPNLCGEASICNWCLHEEDSLTSSAAKATHDTNDASYTNADTSGNGLTPPIPAAHVDEQNTDEVLLKKGHGKAFEYLLLIAAQSLPQVIREANGQIKQANDTASMINDITNPKMGCSDNKARSDLERKGKMGCADDQGKISDRERLMMGVPKRQRCSKGMNAAPLKCRKKGLQLSPGRPNYRRYKLLADVVC